MSRIDLHEDYSVRLARQTVRDSVLSHGEECIALQTYHVGEDEGTAERCPYFDDIYKQSEHANCSLCYNTTFVGIKSAVRIWGIFTDNAVAEQIGQNGVWSPDQCDMQTEAFPLLAEHDFIVRVRMWDASHKPLEIEGYYGVQQVTRNSLRTGNRFGQYHWDIVGQKATVTKLQKNSPIYNYPVLGLEFPDSSLSRGVTQPQVRITY